MPKALDPYKEYENNAVNTADPKKLIVMLYSGAIDFLTESLIYIDDYKSYDKANEKLLKAQDIITELILCLDMEKGGEIAQNLLSLYTYMKKELFTGNMNKDPKPIESVIKYLKELYEAWVTMDGSQQSASKKPSAANKNQPSQNAGGFVASG